MWICDGLVKAQKHGGLLVQPIGSVSSMARETHSQLECVLGFQLHPVEAVTEVDLEEACQRDGFWVSELCHHLSNECSMEWVRWVWTC